MQQVEEWFDVPGHSVQKLADALGISRQAIYNGRERGGWGARVAAGMTAIMGFEVGALEDRQNKRFAKEALRRWKKINR